MRVELAVTGLRTTIVGALVERLKASGMPVNPQSIGGDLADPTCELSIPEARRYVLAAGVLFGKRLGNLTAQQINVTLAVNLLNLVRICEAILERQADARICVIGSLSGIRGSFDECYAVSKAGLHGYVQFRETKWPQQLFAVAPSIISDSGMTMRRPDYPEILTKRSTVTAARVAEVIHEHLWDNAAEVLTNSVVVVK